MQTCPNCGQQNRPGVIFCENCGASLIGKLPLSTKALDTEGSEQPDVGVDTSTLVDVTIQGTATFERGMLLRLEVEGSPDPIRFTPKAETIFGRRDPATGDKPDIDLTPFAGYRMGVSRRHAAIRPGDENGLDLWDLGSSNGTFLNGQRLSAHRPYRLRDGDEIRLGQMVIHIYFEREASRTPIPASIEAEAKAPEAEPVEASAAPAPAAHSSEDRPTVPFPPGPRPKPAEPQAEPAAAEEPKPADAQGAAAPEPPVPEPEQPAAEPPTAPDRPTPAEPEQPAAEPPTAPDRPAPAAPETQAEQQPAAPEPEPEKPAEPETKAEAPAAPETKTEPPAAEAPVPTTPAAPAPVEPKLPAEPEKPQPEAQPSASQTESKPAPAPESKPDDEKSGGS